MNLTVHRHKTVALDPFYVDDLSVDYDAPAVLHDVLTASVLQPANPAQPATLIADGQDITSDLPDIIAALMASTIDADTQILLRSLFYQCLNHYDPATTVPINELYANQAATAQRLPAPSTNVRYTIATDISPAAKQLVSDLNHDLFFPSIAYIYHPKTLGVWFRNEQAFEEFKVWADAQVTLLSNQTALDAKTLKLLRQLQNLKLSGLTESLLLRRDATASQQPYSFARILVHLLMTYASAKGPANNGLAAGTPNVGLMPFSVDELIIPTSLVFANVQAHAQAAPPKIHRAWDEINKSLALPVKMISNNNLSKLTAQHRAMQRVAAAGKSGAQKAAKVVFRKKSPPTVALADQIMRRIKRMQQNTASQNVYSRQVRTFTRASRRDPTGLNNPGISKRVAYYPDLHVYLDTSGSISESNYQAAILMLIQMAKKMNVNIYFNSFSSVLSQPVLLKTANKSVRSIYREFARTPKVTGGTDFEQIWTYINASAKRRAEFSLMITDFAWTPRSSHTKHPKNLYYAPIADTDWSVLTYSAARYVESMQHIEPNLPHRLIGLYA